MNIFTPLDFEVRQASRKVSRFTAGNKKLIKIRQRPPLFMLFLLGLMSFWSNVSYGQSICPDVTRCNAKDVKINSAFLADANGQPIRCVTGATVNAYLFITVSSNATRQGLRFAGTVTINGVATNLPLHCFDRSLKGTNATALRYPTAITWTCGQQCL
jgi:hypothetical protein